MRRPIAVWSRHAAEQWDLPYPYIHIVIHDPGSTPPVILPSVNRIAALFLEFHDVDPRRRASQTGRRISMTVEDARAILDLIDDHPDVDVAVSCETGISRSAGIAAALCAIFGLPDDYIYKGSLPNNHCKQMLLTEAYRRYEASVQTPRVETL